jgi:4-amino-4-deoxy-L-arabinose transferase-like glycosyltransferase
VSRHRLILLAIVLAGVGIRFSYAAVVVNGLSADTSEGQIAHNILADGRWFERNEAAERQILRLEERRHLPSFLDPASIDYRGLDKSDAWVPEISESVGISAVMAGVWAITGDERYIQVKLLQGIVDGLTSLLVYWIAMQLFKRRRPALIAAALYAAYPPIAWQTASTYNDIWAIDLTVAIVALYLIAMRSGHRWRWWIACGVCAGIGAYFRPAVIVIVPALAVATALSTGWREAFRRAALATVVACVMLVPWTVRNYKDFHAFVPTRSAFWLTAWGGLNEMPNDFGETFTFAAITAKLHHTHPNVIAETPAWDSDIKEYVIRAIEQHPLWYLELLARRTAVATVWPIYMGWLHFPSAVEHPLATLKGAIAYTIEPAVFILAMLGLALTRRRWREQHAILLALVLAVLLPYLAVHVEDRYLLPAVPAYMIWIGLGADRLIERATRRSGRARGERGVRSAFGRADIGFAPQEP